MAAMQDMRSLFIAFCIGGLIGLSAFGAPKPAAARVQEKPSGAATVSLTGNNDATLQKATVAKVDESVQLLNSLKDDTVFVSIGKRDRLLWKDLKEQALLSFADFSIPKTADPKELEEVKRSLLMQHVARILRNYLLKAAVAVEAERQGLKVSADELQAARDKTLAQYSKRRGAATRRFVELIKAGNSFYEQNLTNSLLQIAYVEKFIRPSIVVTPEQIEKVKAGRRLYNDTYKATNEFYRAQLKKVRADLLANKITYDDASLEYSEAPDGVWGTFEPGELPAEVAKACANLPVNGLSEVVETSNAVQIVKMLKRNHAEGDDGKPDVKKLESYELSHIYIEKLFPQPDLTDGEAREKLMNAKIRRALKKKQIALIKTTPITCVIPLTTGNPKTKSNRAVSEALSTVKQQPLKDGDRPANGPAVAGIAVGIILLLSGGLWMLLGKKRK